MRKLYFFTANNIFRYKSTQCTKSWNFKKKNNFPHFIKKLTLFTLCVVFYAQVKSYDFNIYFAYFIRKILTFIYRILVGSLKSAFRGEVSEGGGNKVGWWNADIPYKHQMRIYEKMWIGEVIKTPKNAG